MIAIMDRVPNPTPAEIAERAAEIRAGWSEERLRFSATGVTQQDYRPYTIPELSPAPDEDARDDRQ